MPLWYKFRHNPSGHTFECPLQCQQCEGRTKNGSRCRKRVCIGVPLCWQHLRTERFLRIGASPIAGKGLFVFKPGSVPDAIVFHQNDRITHYDGERIGAEVHQRYPGDITAPYALMTENAACKRGVGSLANHAPAGNGPGHANARYSQYRGRGQLRATRDIRNGEEVLVNYGPQYQFENIVSATIRRRT